MCRFLLQILSDNLKIENRLALFSGVRVEINLRKAVTSYHFRDIKRAPFIEKESADNRLYFVKMGPVAVLVTLLAGSIE